MSSVQYIVYTIVYITICKLYSIETTADSEHSTLAQLKYLYHIAVRPNRVTDDGAAVCSGFIFQSCPPP